ncbi:hypothetical protein [Metabacillus fastidiosus]|uniref:hypothetical protein n=1 Tax=Metabacillus fastidiosus TaxID=1458 RepID=UPI003D2B3853
MLNANIESENELLRGDVPISFLKQIDYQRCKVFVSKIFPSRGTFNGIEKLSLMNFMKMCQFTTFQTSLYGIDFDNDHLVECSFLEIRKDQITSKRQIILQTFFKEITEIEMMNMVKNHQTYKN